MRIVSLVFVLLIAVAGPAFSSFSTVQIEPNDPIVGDVVTVTVFGYLSNTCISLEDQVCGDLSGQEVVIEIFTYDCLGRECTMCGWETTPYEVVCEIQTETAGTHIIQVIEHIDSLHFPGTDEMAFEFQAGRVNMWTAINRTLYKRSKKN